MFAGDENVKCSGPPIVLVPGLASTKLRVEYSKVRSDWDGHNIYLDFAKLSEVHLDITLTLTLSLTLSLTLTITITLFEAALAKTTSNATGEANATDPNPNPNCNPNPTLDCEDLLLGLDEKTTIPIHTDVMKHFALKPDGSDASSKIRVRPVPLLGFRSE